MKKIINSTKSEDTPIVSEFIRKWEEKTEMKWETENKIPSTNNPLESIISDLSIPEADIALIPIHWIPIGGNENLSIGTLLPRRKPGIIINYKLSESPVNHLIKLGQGALIGCDSENIMHQMMEILPEFNYRIIENGDITNLEGVIIIHPENRIMALTPFDSTFVFNPKELIPPAGEKIIAAVCLKSYSEIREQLLDLNESQVSRASNIERRIQKKLVEHNIESPHVYCEIDHQEYYHVYLSAFAPDGSFHKTRLSTSVSAGAEDEILNQFFDVKQDI